MKRKWIVTSIGILGGAITGWSYYHNIGCASGMCPITSSPVSSTMYGAVMGGLVVNMVVSAMAKEKGSKDITQQANNHRS